MLMTTGGILKRSTGLALVALAAALFAPAPDAEAQQSLPKVMSLNLCTDQLAMALADPEQLMSVSFLARDRTISPMWREAQNFPVNHGIAEEVFLAQPDLVVTGTFSQHNTTFLLRRVGLPVEEFDFAMTLETIPSEIRRMGALLHQQEKAEKLASDFAASLDAIEKQQCEPKPTILAFEQNGISPGKETLADSVFRAAGFRNLAAEAGLVGAAPFPLELVVAQEPDVIVVQASEDDAPTLGAYVLRHPAMKHLNSRIDAFLPPGSWACNGPLIIDAVKALAELRQKVAPCAEATE